MSADCLPAAEAFSALRAASSRFLAASYSARGIAFFASILAARASSSSACARLAAVCPCSPASSIVFAA